MPSKIRVVGLVVAALWAGSCTTSQPEPSRSPRASTPPARATPSVSLVPRSGARTTNVGAFQLVSRSFGVALVERCVAVDLSRCRQRLVASEDFGTTWTDITPVHTALRGPSSDVKMSHLFFLDREHGWVTANDCAGGKAVLFRTASGGRTWTRTPIPASSCNAGAGHTATFVDARNGWLVHLEPTGSSASLQRTTDGGKTWSREQDFEWISGIRFVDPFHGWLGGVTSGDEAGLLRTADGGRSWTDIATPVPACCRRWIALSDAPTFFDDRRGVLPVTLRDGDRSRVVFDVTSDGGDTWHVASMLPPVQTGASGFPSTASVAITTPTDWWVLDGEPPVVRRTTDGGRTWRPVGIPETRWARALGATDGRHAWITVADRRSGALLATRDGGLTWRALVPFARPNSLAVSTALRTVLPLPGPVTAVARGADGLVYASYLPLPNGNRQVVVRFDPGTGSVERSPPIRGGQGGVDRLAVADGSVWVSTGAGPARPGRILYRLDARSLEVRDRPRMPGPTGPLAAVPVGVWAVAGRRIVLFDPGTGDAIRSATFRGRAKLMVADPSGRRLYVSTSAPIRDGSTPIFELDAATGEVLARAWQCCADLNGPSGLSATLDGVWVTWPTGMMASLTFLREGDLRQTAVFAPGGSNGLTAYVARGVLWVDDLLGGYYCADASSGALLGHVGIKHSPSGISNIVSVPSGLYVGVDGLARIRTRPDCSSG